MLNHQVPLSHSAFTIELIIKLHLVTAFVAIGFSFTLNAMSRLIERSNLLNGNGKSSLMLSDKTFSLSKS